MRRRSSQGSVHRGGKAEPAITRRGAPPGPQPVKQRLIVDDLHGRIIRGELAPGLRLPTRRELCDEWDVSMATVQQALEQLTREGFVEARGAAGTFIVDRPPHTSVYALVFPVRPTDEGFVRFWTALGNEAIRFGGAEKKIVPWYGIDGHVDNDDFQRLCDDAERHRVAGLIFAASPHKLAGTRLLTAPGLPRVAVMSRSAARPDCGVIDLDSSSFITSALDYLASRKRKRIALITAVGLKPAWHQATDAALLARGMTTQPYWRIGLSPVQPEAARACAHLLMNPHQTQRPDALVITDDNMVEHATAGLIDAGVKVPGDLDVVAHCNFPWPTPSVVPVRRLGYDARELLAGAVRMIDDARRGKPMRDVRIPARFEDQLTDVLQESPRKS